MNAPTPSNEITMINSCTRRRVTRR
jgi:hypothetical protein